METQYTSASDEHPASEQDEQPTHAFAHKFLYPEFAGYEGERLLKSILHKILPMALYRTWEILTERQAQGNDSFLSIAKISKTADRAERTIRLNIHELEARKLLSLRPAQKVLRQTDGSLKLKLVVIKDFSGLYALAHEYLLWTQSDDYIEPQREFAEVILSDERLVKKLLRFNNYRRILRTNVPGPKPREREEHRWYSAYDPATDEQEVGAAGGTTSPTGRAEGVERQRTPGEWHLFLQENSQEQPKKDSQERVKTRNHTDQPDGDSSDSQTPPGGRADGYTKTSNEQPTRTEIRKDSSSPPTKTNLTNPSIPGSKKDCAEQPTRREADRDERARAFVQRAMAAYEITRGEIGRRGEVSAPKAKPNALVSAFVREVSPLFRDQNVKGSLTRALRAVQDTQLTQKDILACLVKAYSVTLETKKVREQYRRPDGDIKMPLFCTMFARFVADCASGRFGYTDEHLARDIVADDRLVLFLVEHDLEGLLDDSTVTANEAPEAPEEQEAPPQEEDEKAEEEKTFSDEAGTCAEPEQPCVNVSDPSDGWANWESAEFWANRLREHYSYGANDYRYEVLPACYEGELTHRWVFVFYAVRDPQHCFAIYGNKQEIAFHLESTESAWTAYDGVVGSPGPTN